MLVLIQALWMPKRTTQLPSRKMFLHLSKLKNEKRCSQRRQAFRAQGWDELFGMPGAWMGTPKVSRWRNTVLYDYTAFRSTLSLHCFNLISIWITGHTAQPLLSSLSFAIHLSRSPPFSLSRFTHFAPCIHIHLVNSYVRRCMGGAQNKIQCSFLLKNNSQTQTETQNMAKIYFTGDGCFKG